MKLQKINIVFLLIGVLSFMVFGFLVAHQYAQLKSSRDVIKTFASILFPIPIGLFARCMILNGKNHQGTMSMNGSDIRRAVWLLLSASILMMLTAACIEILRGEKLEEFPVVLHLINSSLVNAYFVNEMTSKNFKVMGILSGLIIGLASYIFFL